MRNIHQTTGRFGEYNINSTNTTDNVVNKIKEYELSFNDSDYLKELKEDFMLKNIGIRNASTSDIIVSVNNRPFTILVGAALNLPYLEMIESIVFKTSGAMVSIRYVY